jgi:hypothetical protein
VINFDRSSLKTAAAGLILAGSWIQTVGAATSGSFDEDESDDRFYKACTLEARGRIPNGPGVEIRSVTTRAVGSNYSVDIVAGASDIQTKYRFTCVVRNGDIRIIKRQIIN